jgi:hypothetical protein
MKFTLDIVVGDTVEHKLSKRRGVVIRSTGQTATIQITENSPSGMMTYQLTSHKKFFRKIGFLNTKINELKKSLKKIKDALITHR